MVLAVGAILLATTHRAGAANNDRWLRVTAPEFTLITSLPEKDALAWTDEFSQFVGALQGFIPVDPRRLPRLTVVVFARERDYIGYRPLGADGKPKEAAGFFSRRESWAVAGLSRDAMGEETQRTIFHEGTHWFLSAFEQPNPVWLEEGLAEVFSTFAVDRKKQKISWGRAIDEHVATLQTIDPMPLERLLFLAQDDLFTGGEEGSIRTGIAYAESWAFVHYLTFGQRDVPPQSLMDYVRAMHSGMHPDEAFKQAFGHSYAEIDAKLRTYLNGGRYFVASKPLVPVAGLKAEPATPAEVEDALARLCLAGSRRPAALEHAQKAVAANGEGPLEYELLGQVELENGDKNAALAAFAKAVEKGSHDFLPYFQLARAKHEDAVESDGSVRNLSSADARAIANDYERAINFRPRFRPAYQSLAGIVELVPPGNEQDKRFLELGRRLFPEDGMIRIGLAVLAKRAGDEAAARQMLAEVLDPEKPLSLEARGYAHRLEEFWQQGDANAQIETLVKDKKYTEAIAVADQQVAGTADPMARRHWSEVRQNIAGMQRFDAVRAAWEARKWTEARALLNEILESDAPAMLKLQARTRLQELDRRGLGKAK